MLLRLKLRLGAWLLLVGAGVAAVGELFTLWSSNPLTGNWFVSMSLIVLGTLALLYGITTYAQLSEEVTLFGLGGVGLLILGGFVLLLGTVVLNMVVVPLLLGMAATVATVLNAPGSAVQSATNSVGSGLNSIGGLFGSGSSVPSAQIPQADGIQIVSNTLVGLHLPTLVDIGRWGHFFSSGGSLTFGCLLLGFALLKQDSFSRPTCYALISTAGLNLLFQLLSLSPILPSVVSVLLSITGLLLFAALALFGAVILFPGQVSRFWSASEKGAKKFAVSKKR